MMDFEGAAARLARDQSKIRGRQKTMALSDKAKKQAEFQKKHQARIRAERERKKRTDEYQQQYIHKCERLMKEKSLGPAGKPLLLSPTSIYGDGDKIALPPSVLETLTTADLMPSQGGTGGNPWTFRIGILNPEYKFPASPLVQNLRPLQDEGDPMDEDSGSEGDEEQDKVEQEPYLEELGHKYLAYTHCTVVEFTQEEGCVGIPQHIASSLLDPNNRHVDVRDADIPKTRTIDPAAVSMNDNAVRNEDGMNDDPTTNSNLDTMSTEVEDQTPGHLAWGAFDIPDVQLEITMVKLPKGKGCTLTPTKEAVQNGFYGLKDVRLVLEQSLIRTRATLSKGDVVSTWHRGVRFDLDVSKVIPSAFHAVTCINTDIEVDIGEVQTGSTSQPQTNPQSPIEEDMENIKGFRLGTGQTTSSSRSCTSLSPSKAPSTVSLLPEPPEGQKDGVCTILIRYSGGQGKRRFAVETASVEDLFAFASSIMNRDKHTFQLVTRFPRRELSLVGNQSENSIKNPGLLTLSEAGLQQGQEMFMVENL